MKKIFAALVLLFVISFISGTEVFADNIGLKDAQNKPVFPGESLVKDGAKDMQIYDEPGIFLDIATQYYRDLGEFDTAPDDFKKIVADTDFTPFVLNFRNVVRKNWTPVDCANSCEVMLLMSIDNSGKLVSNEIFRSSGNEVFDKSVLDAVQKSAPFNFMPVEYKFNNLTVWFGFKSELSKNASDQDVNKQADFKFYLKNMQKRIKKNWKPPKHLDQNSRTVLFFTVNKQGEVTFCKVLISSKDEASDKSAIDAVKAAAPFETLPKAYKGETIDVMFTFDYKVVLGHAQRERPLKNTLNCSLTDNSPSKSILNRYKNKEQKKIFKGYLEHISQTLGKIKIPHTKESILRVKFSIDKTGAVQNAKITASNGNNEFNQAVLSQIKNIKFNSIPKDLGISMLSVEYQFDNLYRRPDTKQSIKTLGATAGATGLLILLFGGL